MTIADILEQKGRRVVTIRPDQSVDRAARTFAEHGVGALPVVEDRELVGMLSERDALRVAATGGRGWRSFRVASAMSEELLVLRESDELEYAVDVMTRKRIRHLPVVEGARLRGLVSIGDALKALRGGSASRRELRRYSRGRTY